MHRWLGRSEAGAGIRRRIRAGTARAGHPLLGAATSAIANGGRKPKRGRQPLSRSCFGRAGERSAVQSGIAINRCARREAGGDGSIHRDQQLHRAGVNGCSPGRNGQRGATGACTGRSQSDRVVAPDSDHDADAPGWLRSPGHSRTASRALAILETRLRPGLGGVLPFSRTAIHQGSALARSFYLNCIESVGPARAPTDGLNT